MANVKNAKKKIIQIAKTTKAHEQLKSTVKNAIYSIDGKRLPADYLKGNTKSSTPHRIYILNGKKVVK